MTDGMARSLVREAVIKFLVTEPASDGARVNDLIDKILGWCERNRCHIVDVKNSGITALKEIPDPPKLLFVCGNRDLLSHVSLAVVGTRRPSAYGVRAALSFSSELAQLGFCVVSGLASGIDTAAHRGALLRGKTIAVVAHGLDRVYPSSNRVLAQEIARSGCLISEYPPFVPPQKYHFPRRNRIISALSLGCLVVQAAEKSGSLITARHALEQNREVFIVPSAYDDETFKGSHQLIQEGAKLVTSIKDILAEFPLQSLLAMQYASLPPSDLRDLKKLFDKSDGSLSLEEITAAEGKAVEWMKLIELAKEKGQVYEAFPQRYVWVGSRDGV